MHVLVTGANGFVGSTLCVRMLADGWQVRGTVRDSKSLERVPAEVYAVQVESIGPETDWSKALDGVDAVIHLAARVHVINDTASDPIAAFRWVNVKGTERLARMAAAAGCRRFFFMSSVKVNGERTDPQITQITRIRKKGAESRGQGGVLKGFFSEEDVPEPQDPYAVSKWEAEQALHKILITNIQIFLCERNSLSYRFF